MRRFWSCMVTKMTAVCFRKHWHVFTFRLIHGLSGVDGGSGGEATGGGEALRAEGEDGNPFAFTSPDLLPAVDLSFEHDDMDPERDLEGFGLPEVLWEGHECFGKYTPFEALKFTNTKVEHKVEFEVACSAEACRTFCMTWSWLPACFDLVDMVRSLACLLPTFLVTRQ
jgi:hypothetical protein